MSDVYSAAPVIPDVPFVDPETGSLTQVGFRFMLSLWYRTGQSPGVNATALQAQVISNTTTVIALESLSAFTADPIDPPPDLPPPLLFDLAPDPAPDMGDTALLALVLGDVA